MTLFKELVVAFTVMAVMTIAVTAVAFTLSAVLISRNYYRYKLMLESQFTGLTIFSARDGAQMLFV